MSDPAPVTTIWLIDDDERFRERLSKALSVRSYEVRAFTSGSEALKQLEHGAPTHAIVDLRMPGEWGLHVVQSLLAQRSEMSVIVLTAYGSIATAIEAVRLGALSYLQKPASVDEVLFALFPCKRPTSVGLTPQVEEVPTLASVEWEHINRVLTECDGNIRKTAKLLGMHRRTLQRKLAKLP